VRDVVIVIDMLSAARVLEVISVVLIPFLVAYPVAVVWAVNGWFGK
jgi:hypothetical protein